MRPAAERGGVSIHGNSSYAGIRKTLMRIPYAQESWGVPVERLSYEACGQYETG